MWHYESITHYFCARCKQWLKRTAFAAPSKCFSRFAPSHLSARVFFLFDSDWFGNVLSKRRQCHRKMNKAAVSFWSVKSPSQDEYGRVWCETYVLKLTNCFSIDLLGRYSAAPLESYKHPYQLVASAGSLAVILQPAFVPFVRAVDYLPLVCLFIPE